MRGVIKFNAGYFTSSLKKSIIINVLLSILIFLGLNIDLNYRYLLSMFFVFLGILIVFYLNKYDPESIEFEGKELKFTFFNKVFFKTQPYNCKRQEIVSYIEGESMKIYKGQNTIAIIRNSAVSIEDWDKLKSYFVL